MNRRKILNDPVYGFISIPEEPIFSLINHSSFQRLNRIRQLGLTYLVYPGANHTRFNHAIGAMHLMSEALTQLRGKGFEISQDEFRNAMAAILLHDIGHGPFSHALEHSIIENVHHESLSLSIMQLLAREYPFLEDAIPVFTGTGGRKFLHQLVSGQLDVDRLDYLSRDSFFTGVSEGVVGTQRIISMLTLAGEDLAIEEKGIYSIEKFIVARRLMYWQVYFHKTVVSAEGILIQTLKRAKELSLNGESLLATPALNYFLKNKIGQNALTDEDLQMFLLLDDNDIISSLKVWQTHSDKILAFLAGSLINRRLFKTTMRTTPYSEDEVDQIVQATAKQMRISAKEAEMLVISGSIANKAYEPQTDKIWICSREEKVRDITEASDQLNLNVLSESTQKFYLTHPKFNMLI